MKILHVVPSYKPAYVYGGPIESVASLCEALTAAGHELLVLTTTANGETELLVDAGKKVVVDTVPVIYFPRITKGNTHVSPGLWKYLYKHCLEFDIVHIHSWWNTVVIIASLICHQRGMKVIISPRGMLSDYIMTKTHGTLKKWIHNLFGRNSLKKTVFHATSLAEFAECQRVIPGWNGFLLPNIIRLPAHQFSRHRVADFTLLFLSRIHPKKGLEYLLEALAQLTIPVRLRIAGSGDEAYVQALKDKATALNLDGSIDWVGWKNREEKYQELASADLFVLTSHNENFANAVIESLYVGTPVLLSSSVGLASFVEENKLGWITDLEEGAIAKSIEAAFQDKSARMRINEKGRECVIKAFSEKILAQQYVEQYAKWTNSGS